MCEDIAPNFGNNRTGCCITTAHRYTLPFSPRNFLPKKYDCRLPPTLIFSVSQIENRSERPSFSKVEVIEAESEAVLNTTQNTTCMMHLKMAEALGTVNTRGTGLLGR
jgi:hypothetical protein